MSTPLLRRSTRRPTTLGAATAAAVGAVLVLTTACSPDTAASAGGWSTAKGPGLPVDTAAPPNA